jgi:hypothetical protein
VLQNRGGNYCSDRRNCYSAFIDNDNVLCISHTDVGTKIEGVREYGAEENIWAKRDEATGEWRRLRNVELNDLYLLPNIIRVIKLRKIRWAGHVARMGERRDAYMILVGRPEGRRPPGRPRRRWEDNSKMDLQEVGWGMDWIELA